MTPGPAYLELPLPAPFRAVISTRLGGVSPPPWDSQNHGTSTGDEPGRVARNGGLLAAALGLPGARGPEDWALVSQVHGTGCLRAQAPGGHGQADGLWTSRPGLPLGIRVADCSAVVLAHPPSGRLGMAHAGWRGAAAGVVTALLRAMDVPPAEVSAAISPHLGRCCFEVGPEVVQAFGGRFCEPGAGDRWRLDMGAALRWELLGLGLRPEAVGADGRCTG
jgi:polyphenol oxidase